ncbi:MAG: hypothetical protein Q9218_005785, partial [Villophora microphyllina]
MALSKKKLYQKDQRWVWKMALRVIAIAFAWVAGGCMGSMLHRLRKSRYSERNGYDQADMFILPWLLMTLALSNIWNAFNILTALFSSRRIPASANLACDVLIALSLLASAVWVCIITTTTDNILHIYINSSYTDYCNAMTELIGIAFTFLTA